jgi:hypothetical protein
MGYPMRMSGLGFTAPIGRGLIWRQRVGAKRRPMMNSAANPGEGSRSLDRPYPLSPTLSPCERGLSYATMPGGSR